MAVEIETKLIILADEPGIVMEKIASSGTIGACSLTDRRTLLLRDTYYDTPTRTLSGRGVALRTRDCCGEFLEPSPTIVCIKQGEHRDASGAFLREEVEFAWSGECPDRIVRSLELCCLPAGDVPPGQDDPQECLSCIGLVPIQERTTQRRVLDASWVGSPETGIIAELALDTVCYDIHGCQVLHHEIEVETKAPGSEAFVACLTDLLRQAFRDDLGPWDHNKLITGLALEHLYAQGILPARSGQTLHLSRPLYDAVDAFLKQGRRYPW